MKQRVMDLEALSAMMMAQTEITLDTLQGILDMVRNQQRGAIKQHEAWNAIVQIMEDLDRRLAEVS